MVAFPEEKVTLFATFLGLSVIIDGKDFPVDVDIQETTVEVITGRPVPADAASVVVATDEVIVGTAELFGMVPVYCEVTTELTTGGINI